MAEETREDEPMTRRAKARQEQAERERLQGRRERLENPLTFEEMVAEIEEAGTFQGMPAEISRAGGTTKVIIGEDVVPRKGK